MSYLTTDIDLIYSFYYNIDAFISNHFCVQCFVVPHFFSFVPSHRPGAYPSYFKELPFPFHTDQTRKIQRGAAAARLAGERQYGLYMPISDTVSRQGGGLQQAFDHPSLKGLVQIEEGPQAGAGSPPHPGESPIDSESAGRRSADNHPPCG